MTEVSESVTYMIAEYSRNTGRHYIDKLLRDWKFKGTHVNYHEQGPCHMNKENRRQESKKVRKRNRMPQIADKLNGKW